MKGFVMVEIESYFESEPSTLL